jgi:hypothetical protein
VPCTALPTACSSPIFVCTYFPRRRNSSLSSSFQRAVRSLACDSHSSNPHGAASASSSCAATRFHCAFTASLWITLILRPSLRLCKHLRPRFRKFISSCTPLISFVQSANDAFSSSEPAPIVFDNTALYGITFTNEVLEIRVDYSVKKGLGIKAHVGVRLEKLV